MAAHLNALGIRRISDLKGKDPEALYAQECAQQGCTVDRCALYVYRLAVAWAYGEVLGHVLFCEINPILSDLLRSNRDRTQIQKYIGFMEDMYANGDDEVKNIVTVTMLEYLGDDETVLRNAFAYFSEELMEASKAVEAGWGRRNIRLYRRHGKLLYEW